MTKAIPRWLSLTLAAIAVIVVGLCAYSAVHNEHSTEHSNTCSVSDLSGTTNSSSCP